MARRHHRTTWAARRENLNSAKARTSELQNYYSPAPTRFPAQLVAFSLVTPGKIVVHFAQRHRHGKNQPSVRTQYTVDLIERSAIICYMFEHLEKVRQYPNDSPLKGRVGTDAVAKPTFLRSWCRAQVRSSESRSISSSIRYLARALMWRTKTPGPQPISAAIPRVSPRNSRTNLCLVGRWMATASWPR